MIFRKLFTFPLNRKVEQLLQSFGNLENPLNAEYIIVDHDSDDFQCNQNSQGETTSVWDNFSQKKTRTKYGRVI